MLCARGGVRGGQSEFTDANTLNDEHALIGINVKIQEERTARLLDSTNEVAIALGNFC